jgi:hypothetical protein
MITEDLTNSNPMPLDGFLYQEQFGVSSFIEQTPSSVITNLSSCSGSCGCDSCNTENLVLAETVFSSNLKNDKTKFFGIALNDSGVVKYFLQKSGLDIFEITDSSFGELLPAGSFTSQLKLSTLYLEWDKVLQSYGEGLYSIRVETNALGGGTVSETSQKYTLKIYAENRAEGTVRFVWTQDGLILDNQIDFSGLDIEQEIRLKGNIGYNNEAEILVNEFETSAHNFEQNQDQVIFNYSFQTEPISFFNSNILLKDLIIGNKITVTSYNYFNHWVLTEAELKAATIEEVKDLPFNKCAIFKIKFAERKRNTIKRNYL